MAIQGTGGYNSENNGLLESPTEAEKQMIRVFLIGVAMANTLWCYTFQYAIYILNHRYSRMIDDLPIFK